MPDLVASADGTPIAVWRSGSGPPLVLVHGTTADHTRWAPVLPALEEARTVLAIDRRGRGASGDADDYALEREFEDVAAVVDSAGEQVDLVGHSHGAVCALEAALLSRNLRKLVLYEPPLGYLKAPSDVVEKLEALRLAGERDELLTLFFTEVARQPADQVELMRTLPAWSARLAAADTIPREERVNREYEWDPDRFRRLDVPTLFLLGGDSPEPFKQASDAVAGALPNCEVVVMPGQRHAAMDTSAELFIRELLAFLDGA